MSFNTKENYYLFIPPQFKAKQNKIQPYPKCTAKDAKFNSKDIKKKEKNIAPNISGIVFAFNSCHYQ